MDEEARTTEYHGGGSVGEDERVAEWELGLPTPDDLTPLSHRLLPPELASAFRISPEPHRTTADVVQASATTIAAIRGRISEPDPETRRVDDGSTAAEEPAEAAKQRRLVWTPQLHRRFVEVVGRLGLRNAVPKTIMEMMNVEGLKRENVASHLQKYRLYLKRMEGPAGDGGGGHVAMMPGHGVQPWMQQQSGAFGAVGSYPHRRYAESNDN